jgi:DNA repair exonuclease SbcCD nuclease subunit
MINKHCLQIFEISDIHFGEHKDSELLYQELINVFIKKIKENIDTLDMIIFAGDFWGTKLSLNSKDAKFGLQIINEVYNICKKKGIVIRIIKGTVSHDYNQLNNFRYLQKKNNIFRIIEKVCEEEFEINNRLFKVLYIPEEYTGDKTYYDKYLNKEKYYDLIFGHATFDFSAFASQKIESEKFIKTAPILNSKDFSKIVKGAGLFGHIHIKDNKNLIYYSGSFSRLNFGEEEEKGFYEIRYNLKNSETELIFHENFLAPIFKTIKLSEFFDKSIKFTEDNIELKIKLIEKLKKKYSSANLRIIDDTKSSNNLSIKILKEKYNYDEDIKLKIEKRKDEIEVRDNTFDFILKRELSLEETIQKYILLKFNKNIKLKKIKEIIESSDKEENESNLSEKEKRN